MGIFNRKNKKKKEKDEKQFTNFLSKGELLTKLNNIPDDNLKDILKYILKNIANLKNK